MYIIAALLYQNLQNSKTKSALVFIIIEGVKLLTTSNNCTKHECYFTATSQLILTSLSIFDILVPVVVAVIVISQAVWAAREPRCRT
jgi:hypothetical protein